MASPANSTAIYAVSGLPTSAISLPSISNSPAANLQARAATLGGQVNNTGGETPVVTLYYGTSNGGTNAASWAQSISLGLQAGAFSQNVSNLTPNTLYYFAAKAVNSKGTAWATPSLSFTTPQLAVPVVTNEPAINVEATFATLAGQILSTGGETPAATFYYGTSNGGSNPAAWSHSIAVAHRPAPSSKP